MSNKKGLIHISYDIPFAFEKRQENFQEQNRDKKKLTFIALYRLKISNSSPHNRFFSDFLWYLQKITNNAADISFYSDFMSYLLGCFYIDPWDKLNMWLSNNGFPKNKLRKIFLDASEKELFRSIPSNDEFLDILIFYLYNPIATQEFFIKNMTPSAQDLKFFSKLRELTQEQWSRLIAYAEELCHKDF